MKKLLVLLFSLLISFNSFGEWRLVTIGDNVGNKFYIDFDSVNKKNGYVYYWNLIDLVKPDDWGDLSAKILYEVDCNLPYKERGISYNYYKAPMGQGSPSATDNIINDWRYATPGSVREQTIESVCEY